MLYYHQILDKKLVFFHLGLVLCFYLHLIHLRLHLSESRHLGFLSKKKTKIFVNNFHNIKHKTNNIHNIKHKL